MNHHHQIRINTAFTPPKTTLPPPTKKDIQQLIIIIIYQISNAFIDAIEYPFIHSKYTIHHPEKPTTAAAAAIPNAKQKIINKKQHQSYISHFAFIFDARDFFLQKKTCQHRIFPRNNQSHPFTLLLVHTNTHTHTHTNLHPS